LGYLPEKSVYFLQDLGDDNLYKWLHKKPALAPFDQDTLLFYKRILDNLILFQTRGIDGLDLDLCYPHKSFDRQSMIWDMNYFKYMFLKLVGAPFNELRLEQDFMTLAEFLLAAGHNYFLYRDFQTANIMVVGEDPWFIDYQGGRKGPPQYDIASILYDAKIPMKDSDRELLLEYYIENFCLNTNENKTFMRKYYEGFVIIRIMQALGAFGFRGLYERKPTFTESIVPGVRLLNQIIDQAESHISLPGLYATIKSIPRTEIFINLSKNYHLYISGQ
jgi:aminoglycoside/choline kinase family phosphotransferase